MGGDVALKMNTDAGEKEEIPVAYGRRVERHGSPGFGFGCIDRVTLLRQLPCCLGGGCACHHGATGDGCGCLRCILEKPSSRLRFHVCSSLGCDQGRKRTCRSYRTIHSIRE